MQGQFDIRAVALTDGLIIIAVGIALVSVLEVEKRARRTLLALDWLDPDLR